MISHFYCHEEMKALLSWLSRSSQIKKKSVVLLGLLLLSTLTPLKQQQQQQQNHFLVAGTSLPCSPRRDEGDCFT